ncbi:MAG TPA: bifunctional DNA-formamidopyrimidine glycosylase/DNA-(apurinic or apyrimidinic site) lyase [Pyrinomonadaceae bacterium]|jgi:formamidopyrimidine-DNA glycosylase|nr:bifunctional DNA-formamidopyrimidine glycosylase/DNA-(apurinic or apyrimidinic site) lyase [Pyrinomonadaceae bacterium]
MPELPEVELVARALKHLVAGRTIIAAELLRPGLVQDSTPAEFAKRLRGARIDSVGRRGKHILIRLAPALVLVVHLRMTGRFLYLPMEAPLPKHTHAVFYLDDERRLIFTDQRHFGMMKLADAPSLDSIKELRLLAPEPFSDQFTPAYLYEALSRSRRTLKETLLDQTKVTGLGNIYAAEAMFMARVNPLIVSAEFSRRRVARLHRAILEVLDESISHGKTLDVDPENMDGSYFGGSDEGRWRVYDREGEACSNCRARIRRITQGGRSTYFCPRCQRR